MKYKVKMNSPNSRFKIGDIIDQYDTIVPLVMFPYIFEKVKEPLFVTHDKIELYDKSDRIFGVSKLLSSNSFHTTTILVGNDPNTEDFIWFSTEKLAEKWVEENKPKFSAKHINDAIDVAKGQLFGIPKVFIETLKKELGI